MFHQLFSDVNVDFWRFYCDTKIIACLNYSQAIEKLHFCLQAFDSKKPAIITDHGLLENNGFQTLSTPFNLPIHCVGRECQFQPINDALNQLKKGKYDLLIAIGGGSVLDAAKWLAAGLTTSEPLTELFSRHQIQHQPVPLITIPTTFGTGSEVNMYSHLEIDNEKRSAKKIWLTPSLAILIGDFGVDTPAALRFYSGLDAWLHIIETMTLKQERSPILNGLLKQAYQLHITHFKSFLTQPSAETSLQIATSSCLAGIALNNARTGLMHTLAVPFAKKMQLNHAQSLIPFVEPVLRHNWEGIKQHFPEFQTIEAYLLSINDPYLININKELLSMNIQLEPNDIQLMSEQCHQDKVIFKENPVPISSHRFTSFYTELTLQSHHNKAPN